MDADNVTAPAAESARRRKTRERLIEAAYSVFAERGVAAATVEQIAEQAGFTRGAFYSNFESKEELFFALAERENSLRFDRLEDGVATYLPAGYDGTITAEVMTRLVAEFLDLQPDDRMWFLMQSEFRLLAMRNPAIGAAYLAGEAAVCQKLAERLSDAVGTVGLRFTVDPQIVAGVLGDVYEAEMQNMVLSGSQFPGREAIESVSGTIAVLIEALTVPIDTARS